MDYDRQLLRQFTQHNSQTAFAALTARYLSLVYSTCRRELDDADLAEDVTQAVFLILARKAPSLRREVVLSGWLFQTARFAAKNARLQEQRCKAYEQKAADTLREQQMETEDAAWTEIEPLLNQSLAALRDGERECVLLRFFQGMSFAEAGAALGLSEDAARKRVTRSLEKMRQYFTKNGVIVPSTALAVLLTAHAAKAAPIGLAPVIAQSAASVLAGHTTAALIGSHAYQLSEGTLKAMKIAQVKVVVGITTVAIIGLGFYAASRAMTVTASHPAALLLNASKPGHVLQQAPGKTLTAAQIAERCRAAYAAMRSYQGAVTVVSQSNIGAQPLAWHPTATIQFTQPGKIRVEGSDISQRPYAFVSDGGKTAETNASLGQIWRQDKNPEMAVASLAGISSGAATVVPTLLLGTGVGKPLALGSSPDAEVREDTLDGSLCYVLTAHSEFPTLTKKLAMWIDERTFLLRRIVDDSESPPKTFTFHGRTIHVEAMKTHDEQNITGQRINQLIPDSTFTLPAVQ